ncbi:MAG: hypothetical protein E7582_05865 [Ruminococcaceae bacterium]|nr:hypothetical protein [Oscillospiraceae bacterium]
MKVIGIALVFFSCTVTGFLRANSYIVSLKQFHAFIELLYFIKHEISTYLTAQCEIFLKFKSTELEKCGFLTETRKCIEKSTLSPMADALETLKEKLNINKEAFDILLEYSKKLGSYSPEEECKRCQRAIMELEEIYKKQKEENLKKTSLCRSVGAMTGIGLVLLLW